MKEKIMDESFRDRDPVERGRNGKPEFPGVSALLLERYNLDEVTGEERGLVEAALIEDAGLAERLGELRRSDAAIRGEHPWKNGAGKAARRPPRPLVWGLCAAALTLCIALPFVRIAASSAAGDRIKGNAEGTELRAYLKTGEAQAPLADQAVLREETLSSLPMRFRIDPAAGTA
jgi:hypothetical protein